jgi:hypothetical protein
VFRAILYTQWKWTRLAVLFATVAAFALPVLSVRSVADQEPRMLVTRIQLWSGSYVILAALVGMLVALQGWMSDHRGRHVYALVLPLPRWRYVLLRFAAGVVLLLPVTAALLAGALTATQVVPIPVGLTAYPIVLTVRFLLAALVAFTLFFAISSASSRGAAYTLTALLALVAVDVLTSAAGLNLRLLSHFGDLLFADRGLLGVFVGRWMLIDV